MTPSTRINDLRLIRDTFDSVARLVETTIRHEVPVNYSSSGEPVTALDRSINSLLLASLPGENEGWLSEESRDNPDRLRASRVWIVDPIDGTREFIQGIPQWCVSVGLVEGQEVVAGGVLNPSTGEMFLGSRETGLEIIRPLGVAYRTGGACLLVSRREHQQGKWTEFESPQMAVLPIGSIAYRLAHVAAGYADATCTFEPRSEWDVAGGVALVQAAGGKVQMLDGTPVRFNQAVPRLSSFFAFGQACPSQVPEMCGLGRSS